MPLTPKAYLDRYAKIVFRHPLDGTQVETSLTGYGSGWGNEPHCNRKTVGTKAQMEYAALKTALQKHLSKGGPTKAFSSRFDFAAAPLGNIPATEMFFRISLIHALVGKGSPDEISDTLRLAIGVGRIGGTKDDAGQPSAASTVKEYMERFMTLDCNGLVGNYYGMNGLVNLSVGRFASPAKRRKTMSDIRQGDCLVTHTAAKPREHIALVESWQVNQSDAKGTTGTASIKIVEWGEAGGEDKHYTGATAATVNVAPGPEPGWGVCFRNAAGKYRYVFEPPKGFDQNNGWSDTD